MYWFVSRACKFRFVVCAVGLRFGLRLHLVLIG